jgi:hypothetical protein
MEEGKIATAWAQFGAMKEVHGECVPPGVTLLAWQVGINFSPLVNQPVAFY